jgi:hypothetical protein
LPGLADAAYSANGPNPDCTTVAALKVSEIVQATACGGFGRLEDIALVRSLLEGVLGGLR